MNSRGMTLIEVMAALLIMGGAVIPLLYMRSESFASVQKAVRTERAMHIAEAAINEIYIKGYTFFSEQGYIPEDETGFTVEAEFTAEEVLISSLIPSEQDGEEPEGEPEEGEEEEDKIAVVHISVTVASTDDEDISLTLSLDFPADTAEVEGLEEILPQTSEDGT